MKIQNQLIDESYCRYVNHWKEPIDPINYKLYSIETTMPCFHSDNRLFNKEEFVRFIKINKSFSKMWGI